MPYKFNIFTGNFDIVSAAVTVATFFRLVQTGDTRISQAGDNRISQDGA